MLSLDPKIIRNNTVYREEGEIDREATESLKNEINEIFKDSICGYVKIEERHTQVYHSRESNVYSSTTDMMRAILYCKDAEEKPLSIITADSFGNIRYVTKNPDPNASLMRGKVLIDYKKFKQGSIEKEVKEPTKKILIQLINILCKMANINLTDIFPSSDKIVRYAKRNKLPCPNRKTIAKYIQGIF